MKRVRPGSAGVFLRSQPAVSGMRFAFTPTVLQDKDGSNTGSSCLACPDQRCARFADTELALPTRIEGPYQPDNSVCPTNAISFASEGVVNIDSDACIACGLCASRCPVGAISLDLDAGSAVVQYPDQQEYDHYDNCPAQFMEQRDSLADLIKHETPPFTDASLVAKQIALSLSSLEGQVGQKVLRLLARNAFLLDGTSARLKNLGDNNAWCELSVDTDKRLIAMEVETSADVLDAIRRSLSGSAKAVARFGVDLEILALGLVVTKTPNDRVDFFKVAQDIRSRLGLEVVVVPLAVLLLSIRAGDQYLTTFVKRNFDANDAKSIATLQELFGPLDDPIGAGLIAPK